MRLYSYYDYYHLKWEYKTVPNTNSYFNSIRETESTQKIRMQYSYQFYKCNYDVLFDEAQWKAMDRKHWTTSLSHFRKDKATIVF